jgi:membrane fusion protein (multidrug efflux system)
VKLGRMDSGLWVVTSGLKPGEKIIVDGLQKVRPGAPVKPVAALAAPAGGRGNAR